MWSSVTVPAIVAAVVSVVVTATLGRLWRLCLGVLGWLRPDNQTLHTGWLGSDQGSREGFMCIVRCAPARHLPGRLRSRRIDPAIATGLAQRLAPQLPGVPTHKSEDVVRFESQRNLSGPPGSSLYIWNSGLLEVAIPLTRRQDPVDPARSMLSVEEVASHMIAAVTEVRAGVYRRMFRTRRRLDWALSVSAYARVQPTGQSEPWSSLHFADQQPRGRASEASPAVPVPQFGATTLRSRRQRERPQTIVKLALDDWLNRSGYWDFDAAINALLSRLG